MKGKSITMGKTLIVVFWILMALLLNGSAEAQFTEVDKLQANDKGTFDIFGSSVSVSGDRAIVGAPGENTGGFGAGAAYILERDSSGMWSEVQKLQASDKQTGDIFGSSVSVSGDLAIVGAISENTGGAGAGAAYIFERDSSGMWSEVQKLQASDKDSFDIFGSSVSVSGNRAIVGAPGENTGGYNAGAAYIFERDSSGMWNEVQKLQASDKQTGDVFGSSVSVSGNRTIVGALGENTGGYNAGAAYIFERDSDGMWNEVQKLQASDKDSFDFFGSSVSVSSDQAIVGAHGENTGGYNAGAAYIFERDNSGMWSEVDKLQASDKDARDIFGSSVSVSSERAIVGAPGENTGGYNAGAAYIFERDNSGMWSEVDKLQASDKDARDVFGSSVSVSGNRAIVGALGEDTGGFNAGAAYIFEAEEPVLINDSLNLDSVEAFTDPESSCEGASFGTLLYRFTFTNTTSAALSDVFFEVVILTGGNVLCNADGGPGGVGSTLSVPPVNLGEDRVLSPGESFTVEFEIGLASSASFDFFVDVYGAVVIQ
jgi:hypothetical protein